MNDAPNYPQVFPEWLRQRPDESRDDWLIRQQRSCYFCPHPQFDDGFDADRHELECQTRTPEERSARLARDIRKRP